MNSNNHCHLRETTTTATIANHLTAGVTYSSTLLISLIIKGILIKIRRARQAKIQKVGRHSQIQFIHTKITAL